MEKKINRGVIRTGETDIKVHLIDSFPNHPYHVFDDEDMTELAASIEANGLLNPIIVRSKADGRYELISGHRRKRAYEILKINKIRAIIVDVSDDEAIIMMVDSNCQRSKILPSEKAFSYKMKLDAIKRQGKRNDLTSTQVVSKLRSNEELGKEVIESCETIRRFIRLTNLIPELLDFVGKGRMKMQPAVELSYLDEESQRDLLDSFSERIIRDLYENHLTHKEIAVRTLSNEKEIRLIEAEALRSLSNYKNLVLLEQGITSWVDYAKQISYDEGKKVGYGEGFMQGVSTTRDKDYNPYTNYEFLDMSIKHLELPPKCFDTFIKMNCRKIGDLLRFDKRGILDVKGIGPSTARLISKELTKYGLSHTAWSDAFCKNN